MTQNYINFKRQRDIGEVISDTFKFLRENYRSLFKMIFKIAGPAFLVLLLALAYYSYISFGSLDNSMFNFAEGLDMGMLLISFFVLFCSLLAFYVLLYGTVLHFVRSYVENEGKVAEKEVSQDVKEDFGSLLGLLLLVGVITFFGLILCVLPGIYLWVPLSVAPPLLVIGRQSVVDSISESFNLIKNHWWNTFLTLLIMVILVYIIGLIFQIPLIIYFFVKTITVVQEGSNADPSSFFDWVYIVFNVISSLAQYLLSSIVVIASAFIYYDLNEKKNFTGSYETISNLGSSEK